MPLIVKIILIVLVVLVVALALLYFFGNKARRKQIAQQEQMEAAKQVVTMLVIDKKRLKLKDSGLPQMVIDQSPKLLRGQKLHVVKAKVGARIMTFICETKVFPLVPVKKEIKATVSGLYITDVRGLRGPLEAPVQKKKGFITKQREKMAAKKAAKK